MAEPVVDGLQQEWGRKVQVARLNMHEKGAQPILEQLEFQVTPLFILFDGDGNEMWREEGLPDTDVIKHEVDNLGSGR